MLRRAAYSPALTRDRDLVAALKGLVKHGRSLGLQVGLMTEGLPGGGARFQTVTNVNDFDAFEEQRSKVMGDASATKIRQEIEAMLREPTKIELWEEVVPLASGPKPGGYMMRASWHPSTGNGNVLDFRSSCIELAKKEQARGLNVGVLARVFSPDGPTFQFVFPMQRLSEYEAIVKDRSEESQQWMRTYSGRASKPPIVELWQNVPVE